jgi:hypothetical protein
MGKLIFLIFILMGLGINAKLGFTMKVGKCVSNKKRKRRK